MNVTTAEYTYWDSLDGEALVCSPYGPPEYKGMCNFYLYVLGIALFVEGIVFLYNAQRLDRIINQKTPPVPPTSQQLSSSKQKIKSKTNLLGHSKAKLSHFTRLTYVFGFTLTSLGVGHVGGGMGTVYPSSSLKGQAADLFHAVGTACVLYHLLLQLRGAEAFRKVVLIQQVSFKNRGISISYLLDRAQSIGALPIGVILWVLLQAGVWTRSTFYSAGLFLVASAGIRSVFENIVDRARTLVKIDALQQHAGGDIDAKRRRHGILLRKARSLVFDMLIILQANVLMPLSMFIFKSVDSSTQMLIHHGALDTVMSILVFVGAIKTHKYVGWICAKHASEVATVTKPHAPSSESGLGVASDNDHEYTVADESGLSVVDKSLCEADGDAHGGLFSDLESRRTSRITSVSTGMNNRGNFVGQAAIAK
jgi:hypothetical protein